MDISHKAPTKVEVRANHQSFEQERDSGDSSPCHVSLPSAPAAIPQPMPSPPTSGATQSGREADGLPRTTDPLPTTTTSSNLPLTNGRAQALPSRNTANSGESSTRHVSLPIASSSEVDGLPRTADRLPTTSILPPMDSRAQTLPSRSVTISAATRDEASQANSVDGATRRALAPRLATLPPPMMAGYNAEGRARLTPSLVTRQAPMPLLNLPTLPPPTPSQPARPGRTRAPLRSIPALPMQGPSEAEQDADHENASLEDDEEDEDAEDNAESGSGEGQDAEADSDESGDEDNQDDYIETSAKHPHTARTPRLGPLPAVDTSAFSVSFSDAESSRPQRTPNAQAGPSSIDYFTSKSPEPVFSPMRTPRPADYHPNGKKRVPQPTIIPMPPTPGSPRPGLYHHGSKSMVDLLSMSRKEKDKVISPKLGRALSPPKQLQPPTKDGQPPPAEEPRPAPEPESPDDVITSPLLRRRRSLPVYEPSSDPPPYPDPLFQRRPIQPREEEGNEELPPYSNSIYLTGVMPRKMEFTQPGMQAKDRKWRRVYCVLEGTMFRVYKAPPAASTVSAIEQWWENKVGVGDITDSNSSAVTTSGIRVSAVRERQRVDEAPERPPKIMEESAEGTSGSDAAASRSPTLSTSSNAAQPPPTRSRLSIGARLLHRQRSRSTGRLGSGSNSMNNSSSRLSMDSRQDASSSTQSPSHLYGHGRRSMDTLGSSSRTSNISSTDRSATPSTTLTTPAHSSTMSSASSSEGPSIFSRSRFLSHSHSSDGNHVHHHHHHHHEHKEKAKEKEKEKESEYVPDEKDLIRKYTLQHAESGLASDYTKRKNVIRVRMEGEQFLLQAKDVASVIDWIEGIQMGTNVALDLDERPMPRGPIFPRRRRRRVRRVEPPANTTSS
ncbi:hypothetical protein PYCCODRAFT_1439847 [Trametes coccinea BRFM310]|uniref:PH domain-containing protein n=1 Tax=Trametes coccinea (strain BRFM310) TaxID=1353009 RepID=A0A1Y2I9B4_TRAC3|nr:hypothetical protein PYCCODRAFT_1439847 [Trametes coccinea BRFM310]